VRSVPQSARMPHFSQPAFEKLLGAEHISYLFLGEELGGRPDDVDAYRPDGLVDYQVRRKSYAFRRGLEDACRASRPRGRGCPRRGGGLSCLPPQRGFGTWAWVRRNQRADFQLRALGLGGARDARLTTGRLAACLCSHLCRGCRSRAAVRPAVTLAAWSFQCNSGCRAQNRFSR
jgi:hypothetical protein